MAASFIANKKCVCVQRGEHSEPHEFLLVSSIDGDPLFCAASASGALPMLRYSAMPCEPVSEASMHMDAGTGSNVLKFTCRMVTHYTDWDYDMYVQAEILEQAHII